MRGPSNWATPPDVYSAICQHYGYTPQLDVCAEARNAKCHRYYSLVERGENGLELPWDGPEAVWCNPPYSDPLPWVKRACFDATVPVIMLLKNDPSTKWFRLLLDNADIITMHTRRIQHIPPSGEIPTRQKPHSNNFTSISALILPGKRPGLWMEYWDWKTGDIWP